MAPGHAGRTGINIEPSTTGWTAPFAGDSAEVENPLLANLDLLDPPLPIGFDPNRVLSNAAQGSRR
jgi:hypothetical protein